jgi:hypothetical protein
MRYVPFRPLASHDRLHDDQEKPCCASRGKSLWRGVYVAVFLRLATDDLIFLVRWGKKLGEDFSPFLSGERTLSCFILLATSIRTSIRRAPHERTSGGLCFLRTCTSIIELPVSYIRRHFRLFFVFCIFVAPSQPFPAQTSRSYTPNTHSRASNRRIHLSKARAARKDSRQFLPKPKTAFFLRRRTPQYPNTHIA